MQGSSPSEQDQGWAVLVQADREINRLQALRDSMSDPFDRDAATHDLQAIQVGSDALMDEMSLGDGRSHDAEIRSLSARLQRAMNAGEAAESQPQAPAAR